jgi:plasmid stabilization system protein ParE
VFRVVIEQEARNNLRGHYRSLKARSPDSECPEEWYFGIRAAVRDLAHSAERCGIAFEDQFFAETIRQRLYDSYKILFTVRDDRVHVLHVRHQAQDPEDFLG